MESLGRLVNYLMPYRFRFVASIACALAVAVLWSVSFLTVAPIVEVLFKNDSLQQFVDRQVVESRETISRETQYLDSIAEDNLRGRDKAQSRISDASSNLRFYSNLNTYVMPHVPRDRFNTVALLVVGILIATALKCCFLYGQEILVGSVMTHTANDIRRDCFFAAQSLDIQSVSRHGTPQLLARMTNDVTQLMAAFSVFGTRMIREPLKAITCIGVAWYINWRLTLVAVLFVPMIGLFLSRFGKRLKRAATRAMESVAAIYDCIADTFDSFRVVVGFGGQDRQKERFLDANDRYYRYSMRTLRVSALIRPVTEIMAVIIVCLAFTPGAYMVLRGTDTFLGIQLANESMTITALLTFYAMLAGTLDPIRKLSSQWGMLKQGLASADRVFAVIDTESLIDEPQTPMEFRRHQKEIEFTDIKFRYATFLDDSVHPWSIDDVSLKVQFGEVVAVVGSNGSGKSTLLSLLPRFMDPDEGEIRIDGVNIRDYSTQDLRSQIGIVSQETMLFDDTVFENIQYGNLEADADGVEEAAKRAHAWDFVQMLPDGVQSEVGKGGRKLSGGQRQRLALARAILRDPAILILDEATSAIDAESEDLIHGALKEFSHGRTVFIITHALSRSFLDLVDRVVVMEQGQISASGTHEDLLKSSETYRRLSTAGAQAASPDREAA